MSKATILEHVWDFAFEGDPNIVEVYVRQLRQRIDVPFGRASLQTVRLVGYRLGRRRPAASMPLTLRARTTAGWSCWSPRLTLGVAVGAAGRRTLEARSPHAADELARARVRDLLGARPSGGELPADAAPTSATTASPRSSPPTAASLAASANIAGRRPVIDVDRRPVERRRPSTRPGRRRDRELPALAAADGDRPTAR